MKSSRAIFSGVKFALRTAIKLPGFTPLSVLILGIGAVTVMLGTVNTVVLRPLPCDEPERLIRAWSMTEARQPNTLSAVDDRDTRVRIATGRQSRMLLSNLIHCILFSIHGRLGP